WVKVPHIPANGTTTVILYYGNPSAKSAARGSAVFDFFDDYPGSTIDNGKWSVRHGSPSVANSILTLEGGNGKDAIRSRDAWGTGYAFRYRERPRNATESQDAWSNASSSWDFSDDSEAIYMFPGNNVMYFRTRKGGIQTNDGGQWTVWDPHWTVFEMQRQDWSARLLGNDGLIAQVTTNVPTVPLFVGHEANVSTLLVDWSLVRKLAQIEPTAIVGTEDEEVPARAFVKAKDLGGPGHAVQEELPENTYFWRVRAVDGAGNEGRWSKARYFQVKRDPTPPPVPALVSPENNSATDNTPGFKWSAVDDPSGVSYELQYTNNLELLAAPGPVTEGLLSWWRFDGDGNDSWGGNHGEVRGASFVDGRSGQALSFDGVNDLVTVGNQPSLNFGTGDFSLSVWMRTTHPNSSFFIGKGATDRPGYGVAHWGGNVSFSVTFGSSGFSRVAFPDAQVVDGDWHLVTAVREAGSLKLYIDGELAAGPSGPQVADISSGSDFIIGATAGYFYRGELDDAMVYGRALSADEVRHNYNPSAAPVSMEWLVGWGRRMPVTVASQGALSDYQVSVDVPLRPAMRPDAADIRFTLGDGVTLLPHWVESRGQASARAWVRVPLLNAGKTGFYVYYGNPAASGAENGSAVFEFFDDASMDRSGSYTQVDLYSSGAGGVLSYDPAGRKYDISTANDVSAWTVPVAGEDLEISFMARTPAALSTYEQFGAVMRYSGAGAYWLSARNVYPSEIVAVKNPAPPSESFTTIASSRYQGYAIESGTWYSVSARAVGNELSFLISLENKSLAVTDASYGFGRPGIIIFSGAPASFAFRDVRVRKLASVEPAASVGAEEYAPPSVSGLVANVKNLAEPSYQVPEDAPLVENTYYWRVRAIDGAGNISEWSDVWSFTVSSDSEPPVSAVESISPYWRGGLPFTVTARATDDRSGVAGVALWYRFSQDNMAWGGWKEFGADNDEPYGWDFGAPDGDGHYQFYTIAVDKVGNIESAPEIADASAGVDTAPPMTSHELSGEAGGAGWWRGDVSAKLNATDNLSGVGTTLYRVDENSWEAYADSFTVVGDGVHRIDYYSVDIAGNEENVKSIEIKIDTLPSATSHELSGVVGNAGWWRSDVTVTLSTADDNSLTADVSGVDYTEYRVDGREWTKYSTPFVVSGDGIHLVEYRSADVAGNEEAIKSIEIKIDATPPASFADPVEPYWQTFMPVEITAAASDGRSGVAGVELFYRHSSDNREWGRWASLGAKGAPPRSWRFDAPAGYGFYQVYTAAEDVAGNAENAPVEPDQGFCAVIPAVIDIDPDTLNLNSQGKWITAYIELPVGFNPENIGVGTVALEGGVLMEGVLSAELRPTEVGDHDNDGVPDLMVKFDRSAVQGLVSVGDNIKLTVIGKWNEIPFRGTGSIRVIDPGHGSGGQGNGHGNNGNQGGQGQSQSNQGHGGAPPGQSSNNGQGPPATPPNQSNQGNQGGNEGNGQNQGNGQGNQGNGGNKKSS
ncbi:MAG: DUF2341 domain-containing protein, partial [Candidatus Hadarchaeota archaeon]